MLPNNKDLNGFDVDNDGSDNDNEGILVIFMIRHNDHLHSLAFSCHNIRDDPDQIKYDKYADWNVGNDDDDDDDAAGDDVMMMTRMTIMMITGVMMMAVLNMMMMIMVMVMMMMMMMMTMLIMMMVMGNLTLVCKTLLSPLSLIVT